MSKRATTTKAMATVGGIPARLHWNWDLGIGLTDVDTRRLLHLLTALLDSSALGKAAGVAGMSYRAAWGLLRNCQERLGAELVVMERGRGTRLTSFGVSLVEMDGAARQALGDVHSVWEARMHGLLAPVLGVPPRLTLHASHDLALADWIEHGRQVPVAVTWRGSEQALAALGRGECDIAGFHVQESWSATKLAKWLGRWLTPKLHVCLPAMRRRQGLIVARGNPLKLNSLSDLAKLGARLVNRQRGSGTRLLIDDLLHAAKIDPLRIDGYAHEEFTHDAVAATVAGGSADVGFGIEAAAARYDLDFLPLVDERYGFALRRSVLTTEAGQSFLRRLSGRTFTERLRSLPGYQPLAVGEPGPWEHFLSD